MFFALGAFALSAAIQDTTTANQLVDVLHPANFVSIYELTEGSLQRIPIYCGLASLNGSSVPDDPCEAMPDSTVRPYDVVEGEVDEGSRILIRFDRQWIIDERDDFDGALTIRASVLSGGVKDQLDVPGYSVFGKEEEIAAARIRSSQDWRNIFSSLSIRWNALSEQLADLERALECGFGVDPFDSFGTQVGYGGLSDRGARDRFGPRAEAFCTAVRAGTDSVQIIEDQAGLYRGYDPVHWSILGTFVEEARPLILAEKDLISISLRTLATSDTTILNVISRMIEQDPEVLRHLATTVYENLLPRLAASDSMVNVIQDRQADSSKVLDQRRLEIQNRHRLPSSRVKFLEDQMATVDDSLNAATDDELSARLRRRLWALEDSLYSPALPDSVEQQLAEINLALTNLGFLESSDPEGDAGTIARIRASLAEIDEAYIIIDCSQRFPVRECIEYLNGGPEPSDSTQADGDALAERFARFLKDTDLHLPSDRVRSGDVVEIEIHNGEDDPTLHRFLTLRLKVRDFGWKERLTDSFLFVNRLDDKPQASDAPGADTIPEVVDFSPTPGVSMAWTLYHRTDPTLRWLRPSFGFNVSFPRFGTRIKTRTVETEPVRVEVATEEETDRTIDLAFGLLVGLFDNALQASIGRTLTARSNPWYFAIGFSFVGALETVVSPESGG